jgi:adenosylhomocysteine nucleosidase
MAQVAYLNQVPYLVIRAISDKADNSGQEDYPVFAKKAIVHSVQLLEELYKSF